MNVADLVGPGDLCLDIGSGAGAPALAALVGPRGAVHAFVPRRVALVRVDAAAPAVLAGATRVLRRDRPAWLIEMVPHDLDGHSPADVTDPLGRAGYRMLTWWGGWTPAAGATGQCLFVPPGVRGTA